MKINKTYSKSNLEKNKFKSQYVQTENTEIMHSSSNLSSSRDLNLEANTSAPCFTFGSFFGRFS